MRERSQTSGSNGDSSARAWTLRGSVASGVQIGLLRPALDLDRQQLAGLDQFGDALLHVVRRQPEIVAQVADGGDAERARGNAQQFAMGIGGRGSGASTIAAGSTRSGRS